MRSTLQLAVLAAGALFGAASADATVFTLQVSGVVSGTRYTWPTGSEAWTAPVATSSFAWDLQEGANSFSYGSVYSTGLFTGTITNLGGVLTGQDLHYTYSSCAPGTPSNGCYNDAATASTFLVSGGVPEPATWAMMAAGFAAAGVALRRRPVGRAMA